MDRTTASVFTASPPCPVSDSSAASRDMATTSLRPWCESLAHLTAAAVTCAILAVGLHLDASTDFAAPFTDSGDAMLILPLVKAAVERGSHWRNERLGAPGVQELHDFPVVDHLHFALIWVIGKAARDPVIAFNLFYLLTYPLTTMTGMFALRRLGLSIPAAAAGGILFAFAPYHQLRGQVHYFLSAYFMVPLTLLVVLRICQGRLPFFRREPSGQFRFSIRTGDTLGAVLIAAVTSSAGAYYAYYACLLLSFAGVYGWVITRTWRAAASAGLVTAVIVLGGLANHLPAFAYQFRNGANPRPTQRWPEEAEMYGLKLIQLLLPMPDHNNIEYAGFRIDLAGVRDEYLTSLRPLHRYVETEWGPLGAVAVVGFVGLLTAALLPVRKGWPVGPLAALALFGTLFGTVGGFGDLFNFAVTPQVRAHNRISIYLAFLSVFAACWAVDRFFAKPTGPLRLLRWPAFATLTAFGIWDQTGATWFPALRPTCENCRTVVTERAEVAERFHADGRFFRRVEAHVPGGIVFCYPFVYYPESLPFREIGSPGVTDNYDMARGYLHANSVRWSFGAMKGREWDAWGRQLASEPVPRMLERITLAGFDGLLVDTRGMNPHRAELCLRELDDTLGDDSDRIAHEDGKRWFFDLRDYRRSLERSLGTDRFLALCAAEREPIAWLWLKGFENFEPVGFENRQWWGRPNGLAVVVNPRDYPRRIRVEFTAHGLEGDAFALVVSGELWNETIPVGQDGTTIIRELTVSPGRHRLHLRCEAHRHLPSLRGFTFGLRNFRVEEIPDPPETR